MNRSKDSGNKDESGMCEYCGMSATEAVELLRRGEISPRELVDAAIRRIEAVDKDVNALPVALFERALEQARNWQRKDHADRPNSLNGLPVVIKEYNDIEGVPTTYGSPVFKNNIATKTDAVVRKLESNGAIPIAKSNVPEWAGGNTFNPVYGVTRNPWDLRMSVGGSSGGSAAALASGTAWLATGNDLGGSLRTPAAFCGVVGLRPGVGRVPRNTSWLPSMDTLLVEGPMARCVEDIALMLDAGAGQDDDDPLSFDSSKVCFREELRKKEVPKRIAFSTNLNVVPVEDEISRICTNAIDRIEDMGVEVTDDIPSFEGVLNAFQTLRAVLMGTLMGPVLEQHRDRMAPEIVGNIERGLRLSSDEIFQAERVRWELQKEMRTFFERNDFLVCAATSVAPFPVDQRYVKEINGRPCETYIDWFAITFALTMTGCPTISLPCGFTSTGLPVAIQIVGKPRGEASLLRFSKHIEDILGIAKCLPVNPRTKT